MAALLMAAAASPSAAQEAGSLRWPLRYETAGTAEAAATLLGGEGESRRFETLVEGALVATVIQGGDSAIVSFRVDEPSVSFSADGRELPHEAARIADALRRPAFARVDPAGRIESVRFDPGLGPFQRGVVTSLLAALQFAVPRAPPGPTWETEEDEPNGRYLARYSVTDTVAGPDGPLLVIEKRKVGRPSALDAPLDAVAELGVESSGALTVRYDPARRRVVAAEGSESQSITLGGRPLARTETSLLLRTVGEAAADRAALAATLARAAPPSSLVATEPDAAARAAEARREIGRTTLEATLAELGRAEAEGAAAPDSIQGRLRAFAVLDPATADSLAAVLARAPAGSRAIQAIARALVEAGTEDAHAALAAALRQRIDDRPVASHLIALLGSARPATAAAEAALRELALDGPDPQLAHAARLALGVLARQAARESPERAAGVVHDLVAAYGPAPEGEAARRLLLVLGNTGSPLAVGPALKHLGDPSPSIRAAAAGALRFVRDPAAESLILETLAADSAPAVRLAALDALAFRPPTPAVLAARSRAAREDPDPGVRLAAIQSLWSDRAGHPEVADLVRAAAEGDPSLEVRRRAEWLLGTTNGVVE